MTTTTKPWVDGPFELISSSKSGDSTANPAKGARKVAAEMSLVHNTLFRGINAVYLQCINVGKTGTPKDKLDFANFAYKWGEMVHEHHTLEETDVFPEINDLAGVPGLMDANLEEHKAFHEGVSEYSEYLGKVKDEKEEYDGEKLKGIIDSFMPILRTHLVNEIDTLIALEKYDDKVDWDDWFQKKMNQIGGQSMKSAQYRNEIFPLAIIFHDKTFDDGVWQHFPPIPWIATLLLRWLFMYTHKDWWRFAGCDFTSQPQELPFA